MDHQDEGKQTLNEQQQWMRWMEVLVERAAETGRHGEIPVAALILDQQGRCIGHGRNRRETAQDPLGHAELIALRQAAWVQGDGRFNHCTLLVTLEPCPMCAGALVQARMGTVVFGATDPKRGGLGGCLDLSSDASAHHHMTVIGPLMQERAGAQLSEWFRQRRQGCR